MSKKADLKVAVKIEYPEKIKKEVLKVQKSFDRFFTMFSSAYGVKIDWMFSNIKTYSGEENIKVLLVVEYDDEYSSSIKPYAEVLKQAAMDVFCPCIVKIGLTVEINNKEKLALGDGIPLDNTYKP